MFYRQYKVNKTSSTIWLENFTETLQNMILKYGFLLKVSENQFTQIITHFTFNFKFQFDKISLLEYIF